MRMSERLLKLKVWLEKELCEGRQMKAPAPDFNIGEIVTQEPRVYLAWAPTRTDQTGLMTTDPVNVCPGIVVMPNHANAKLVEEKRFDRYNNVHRNQMLGQNLSVSILFSVYEPGIRLPGFVESVESGRPNMGLMKEGTEEGLLTLIDWMDDCMTKLLGAKSIPGTDLFVNEEKLVYSLYTDQDYVVDRRPIYYGFVNCELYGYANEKTPTGVEEYLI